MLRFVFDVYAIGWFAQVPGNRPLLLLQRPEQLAQHRDDAVEEAIGPVQWEGDLPLTQGTRQTAVGGGVDGTTPNNLSCSR